MTPEGFAEPIWIQLQLMVTAASADWRYWFAHVVTWLSMAKLKSYWDHLPEGRADRWTEAVATTMCFALSLWVFWGHQYMLQICLINGLLNTYLYKLATIILERVGLSGLAEKLKGKPYKISRHPVEQEAEVHGIEPTEETVFLFREGDGKTVSVKRSELDRYRVKK